MTGFKLISADASALINLLGSGVPGEILSSVEAKVVATRQVFREVKRCPIEAEPSLAPLTPLCEGGFLEIVPMNENAIEVFLSLVGAQPPDDLDDGEASTIAYAVDQGAAVVIDERKGRRICRERFPELVTLCSVDLFRWYSSAHRDNAKKCKIALENAIQKARMHIPKIHRAWVHEILYSTKIADVRAAPVKHGSSSRFDRYSP